MKLLCSDLNETELIDARDYYREALSSYSAWSGWLHGHAFFVLCLVGVAANALIVIVLLRPSMRSNPFNHFLVVIAFCDASLMFTYLIYRRIEVCHPYFFTYGFIVYTKYYAIFSVLLHAWSLWLTVNMAVLRWIVLSQGASSSRTCPAANSSGAAFLSMAAALLLAVLASLPNMLRYEITGGEQELPLPSICAHSKWDSFWHESDMIRHYDLEQPRWWSCHLERISFWTAGVVGKLIPCGLLTLFMALLVRMLLEARKRRERLCSSSTSAGKTPAERTTVMLTVIVAVFLVTELPQGIAHLAVGMSPRLKYLSVHFNSLFDLLSLLNSAVNFVLCVSLSNVFRQECWQLLLACVPRRMQQHDTLSQSTRMFTLPAGKDGFVPVPT